MASGNDHSEEIDRLVERAAKDPRTHTFARLADLYRKSGELGRALEVIEEGLRHHPHYLNARLVHARVLRELGRAGEARAAFEHVLEIDSENLVALQALAELGAGYPIDPPAAGGREPSSGWLARLDAEWRRDEEEEALPPTAEEAATAETTAAETATAEEAAQTAAAGTTATAGAATEPEPVAAADAQGADAQGADAQGAEAQGADGEAADGGCPAGEAGPEGEAAAEEETEEAAAPRSRREMETATLASLYVRQGLIDRAIAIYERLLRRDPYNARLAAALEDARRRSRGGPPVGGGSIEEGATDRTPADETPTEEGATDRTPADETPTEETPTGEAPADETPTEETPTEETPTVEAPARGESADEESAAEAPPEETPRDEAPAAAAPPPSDLREGRAGPRAPTGPRAPAGPGLAERPAAGPGPGAGGEGVPIRVFLDRLLDGEAEHERPPDEERWPAWVRALGRREGGRPDGGASAPGDG